MFSKTDFGKRVRQSRESAFISKQQLATILNCSTTKIDDVENGKHVFSIEETLIFSIACNVTLDHLTGRYSVLDIKSETEHC